MRLMRGLNGAARTPLSVILLVATPSFASTHRRLDPVPYSDNEPLSSPTTFRDPDCRNTCYVSYNGQCDDGGYGSEHAICELGSDCDDCGPRLRLPPPPSSSLPPPLPPLPTYFITSLEEFRQSWREALRAATDATIEIAPGSHFEFGKNTPLVCGKDIHLTVFSNGTVSTLDGTHQSRIFRVKGCSLTLRGLSLVNGMAPAGLIEECRNQRTGEWKPAVPYGSFFWNDNACADNADIVRSASVASPHHTGRIITTPPNLAYQEGGAILVEGKEGQPGALVLDSSTVSNSEAIKVPVLSNRRL